MGYTTEFAGEFRLNRPLKPEHRAFLHQFSRTRRMKRRSEQTAALPDPLRKATGLPVGPEGGWYVGEEPYAQKNESPDIADPNAPPQGQPGLWCDWVPNEDGTAICWNQAEKFYDYVEWLNYLIRNFLKPWGYVLNGDVEYAGERFEDEGLIRVRDNVVRRIEGVEPRHLEWKYPCPRYQS